MTIKNSHRDSPSFALLASPLSQELKADYFASEHEPGYYTTRLTVKFLNSKRRSILEVGTELKSMQFHYSEIGEPTGLVFESTLVFAEYTDPERLVKSIHSWDLAIDCGDRAA